MLRVTLLVAAVATAAAGLAGTSREASAQPIDYPYCAMAGGRNAYENCGYFTLEQCLAAVSGVGGHCTPNPRYYASRPYGDRYDEPRPSRRYR